MRWLAAVLPGSLALLLLLLPLEARAGPEGTPPPADVASGPALSADAAILIDGRTARTLWARGADQGRAPASTTKMMTALVALRRGQPDEQVVVGAAAAATPGSSAGLHAGDRYTLGALLRALLLRSGNDAAVAIAIHIAGSVGAFAALMNAQAAALGLQNTHFVNPHGLTAPFHFSSARDLALIARAGLQVPAFAALVDSTEAEIQGSDRLQREIRRELHNTNRLLLAYDWVDGVKTGTTTAAGNCLVASGTRNGFRLIAVVLHSDDRWGDALRLLQWGYAHFSNVPVALPGPGAIGLPVLAAWDVRQRVTVAAGEAPSVPVALDELPRVALRIVTPTALEAPIRRGQRVGSLQLQVAGTVLGAVPLLASAPVPRAPGWLLLWRRLTSGR